MQSGHISNVADVSPPPLIPDHTLLRPIGRGAYGEVWLARNVMGTLRAVKLIWRRQFETDRPYEREFAGIQRLRTRLAQFGRPGPRLARWAQRSGGVFLLRDG